MTVVSFPLCHLEPVERDNLPAQANVAAVRLVAVARRATVPSPEKSGPPRGMRLGTGPWGKTSWIFQWRFDSPRDGRSFLRRPAPDTGNGPGIGRSCGQG